MSNAIIELDNVTKSYGGVVANRARVPDRARAAASPD